METNNPNTNFQNPQPERPSNHLVWSILVTIFCCLPLGIAAIVYSARVDGQWTQGHYDEAQHSADMAKKLCLWSVGIGVAGSIIYAILMATVGLGAAAL